MRDKRFTVLLDSSERELLADLARQGERTQGDVLRHLLRRAARQTDVPLLDVRPRAAEPAHAC